MSRYVNRSLADYVPVSQYMGAFDFKNLENRAALRGVAVGTIGTLVACMIYKKVKGK